MAAKIVVVSGADRGREIWIEEDVVRIGRGSGCAIALSDPKLPEHAATLEFRDGHYNLYSRMEDEVVLADRPLRPRGFDRWPSGKELEIPGAVVLRLETERDPRPVKRPMQAPPRAQASSASPAESDREPDEAESTRRQPDEAEAAKKRSRQLTQVLLILLCAFGGVYLMLLEEEPATGPARSPVVEFARLVTTFYEKKAGEPIYQELRESLQAARAAELREDRKTARTNYGLLRDALVSHLKTAPEGLGPEDRKLLNRTLEFVTARLRTGADE